MRKFVTAGVTAALATAGLLAGTGSASAINRVTCNEFGYTWLISPATTCWANRGSIAVTLYDVNQIQSGNNTGQVASPSGYVNFPSKFATYSFSSRRVDAITIY
ncbi:beta/gamma crystallin domain-containing protein [Actinokineospora auranticolor]|uniref:Beta/gamma crystallin n=1 Tax=Actinokineospora auranticolor TaxID=155976 RepID=A0A2S6H1X1_9PSEU|nr:beta/gamma crystallin domain-containing protein [Actinokineospora auranticolor]PPK71472.1 beta/gamma crystallin [Actinokineospora auranticolor]